MINRVVLVGRITKDPELKSTQANISFVNFTLAVNRTFTDASGERQADFIGCVVWRKQAENLAQYIRKGALLGVEGRIQTRNYEAEDGTTRYITEVVCDSIQFLESRGERSDDYVQHEPTPRTELNDDDENEFYETSKQLAAEEDLPF